MPLPSSSRPPLWMVRSLFASSPYHAHSRAGQIVIHSLTGTESYAFDMKRPIRTMDLEPNFAKRSSRAFVCGGMAESLILREKSWLGHTKETVLHTGEGPVWHVRWRDRLIAWANDLVRAPPPPPPTYWLMISIYYPGRQNLRHELADPHHLHRPPREQPPRGSVQVYAALARRLHAAHRVGRPHQSSAHPRTPAKSRSGSAVDRRAAAAARGDHSGVPAGLHGGRYRPSPDAVPINW